MIWSGSMLRGQLAEVEAPGGLGGSA